MRKYSCIFGGTLLAASSFYAVEVWAWPSKLENIHSGVPQLVLAGIGGIILFTALIWPKRGARLTHTGGNNGNHKQWQPQASGS